MHVVASPTVLKVATVAAALSRNVRHLELSFIPVRELLLHIHGLIPHGAGLLGARVTHRPIHQTTWHSLIHLTSSQFWERWGTRVP